MSHRARAALLIIATAFALALSACDLGAAPVPSATATPAAAAPVSLSPAVPTAQVATPVVVDATTVAPPTPEAEEVAPTEVVTGSEGAALTALQALSALKSKALAWNVDVRLGLLANTRPGAQKNLLGDALGKPEINEATPGGRGRNWTLVAFSPGAKDALAVSMDGTEVDLGKEGALTDELIAGFATPDSAALALGTLQTSKLLDSDAIARKGCERGPADSVGIALLAPGGLGLGPLPTPATGGPPSVLAYELFVERGQQQNFMFFDAGTGAIILDSSAP